MTHYWWMHWFWITSHLTLTLIHSTSSMSTTVSSLQPDPLESSTPEPLESSEPMNTSSTSTTSSSNKTIFSDSPPLENSTAVDVENSTVIPLRKELVSLGGEARGETWTAASITGLCLGVAALAAMIAVGSVVLYRRRYVNKPHALNDKCSNPDSSGYIDDSTMRENSEEMYSLDNDSFLNSLEAMTIQNYWTDSVKHTKL